MDDAGSVNLGNEIELVASDTSSGITTSYTIDVRNNGGSDHRQHTRAGQGGFRRKLRQ